MVVDQGLTLHNLTLPTEPPVGERGMRHFDTAPGAPPGLITSGEAWPFHRRLGKNPRYGCLHQPISCKTRVACIHHGTDEGPTDVRPRGENLTKNRER